MKGGLAVILTALLAGAGGGAACWLTHDRRTARVDRPALALLDVGAAGERLAAVGATEVADRIRAAATRLAAAGYIVLDARAVLAAPPDLYVDPHLLTAAPPAPRATPAAETPANGR